MYDLLLGHSLGKIIIISGPLYTLKDKFTNKSLSKQFHDFENAPYYYRPFFQYTCTVPVLMMTDDARPPNCEDLIKVWRSDDFPSAASDGKGEAGLES